MQARAGAAFVGRVRELGELECLLDAARAGNGATALVAGEAGIGKTRLAAELARRARDTGMEVLLGRSIDLVGTELPYQPFVDALRPLGGIRREAGSRLQVFEATLALLTDRAAAAPVLLVLEDLHWADASTLDLVVFLAHNLDDRPVLLLATYRSDDRLSADRIRRLAGGVRRSGAGLVLDLGPLAHEELAALLTSGPGSPAPPAITDAIVARSEGNPFFAEELSAAAGDGGRELPDGLRETLMARVAGLDPHARSLLRVAAAAGRDVSYPLLRAMASRPEPGVRESLRQAVEHGVLVVDQARGSFRFRHALLAEAVYATILPGEREWLHARLADELARSGTASPAEVAPHWAAAGRSEEALIESVAAAHDAEAVFGLSEAHAHLERALASWDAVADPDELVRLDLAALCSWAAEVAARAGAAPRAVELLRRAIALTGDADAPRAALMYERLGRYLHWSGRADLALGASERAVALVPPEPPSPERAQVLASLASELALAWRFDESLAVSEQALELARAVGAHDAELHALTEMGIDLAYAGRGDEGLAALRTALQLAEQRADSRGLERAYIALTDVLMMLGRPGESARAAQAGLDALDRYGGDHSTLVANLIEPLVASGEWDEADRVSAAALRAITGNYPHMRLISRADVETGRGDFAAARAHLEAARATLHTDRDLAMYDGFTCELALWERRWTDADAAVRDGMARTPSRGMAQIRVWLCAKGLRAQAELAALARARQDGGAARDHLSHARALLDAARSAGAEASRVTPNASGWCALAEAEHARAAGAAPPELWSEAAGAWDRLERPPLAAYCGWRQAEALVASGAPRTEATAALRKAHALAARLGAAPLRSELEQLAERARLDPAPPDAGTPEARQGLEAVLGLTPREAEVLALVARGLTNREIAAALVISVKTAGVHVSHILRKLDAPNRLEAAAIAHRLAPPGGR